MTKRKISRFTSHVLFLALVSGIAFSGPASAAPCSAEIDALKAQLGEICWYGRMCRGLRHKLDSAEHKLRHGRFRHAARRLSDFGWVVESLSRREGRSWRHRARFSRAQFDGLMNPYYVAVADCIANGGTPTPVLDDPATDTGTGTDAGGGTGGAEPPPITVQF